MKNPRITIVTYNWPPRNAIGTHRPYSWAKYWSTRGAEITIITAKKYQFDQPLDLELAEIPQLKVFEVPYLDNPLLTNSSKLPDSVVSSLKYVKNGIKKHFNIGLNIRKSWSAKAETIAKQIANNSDVVISTFGPDGAHLIGSAMKIENPNLLWIADYRDLWSQNHVAVSMSYSRSSLTALELKTVKNRADLVTTVSEDLAMQLSEFLGIESHVITNGFDISVDNLKRNILSKRQPKLSDPFNIIYTGNIYCEFRDPKPLLDAIVHLRNNSIIRSDKAVHVNFYGNDLRVIEKLVKNPLYAEIIKLHGHVSREEALDAQINGDCLLSLETSDAQVQGVVTGKLFEYVSAGTPVIGIGSGDNSAIGSILKDTGSGKCFGTNIDAIAHALAAMINENRCDFFQPDTAKIMRYSRENQALLLYSIMMENVKYNV